MRAEALASVGVKIFGEATAVDHLNRGLGQCGGVIVEAVVFEPLDDKPVGIDPAGPCQ